jgi:hypothetical protein
MSDDSEGFLKRWSRMKRSGEPTSPAVVPEPVEEEIAAPPPADTIPLEEIGSWLKKRLPAGWREIALRRVWSADIAIRDHIGLADYAWDFTVSGDMPGGVPGWGPLTAADDLASLLSRAIGEVQPESRVPIPEELHDDDAPGPAPSPELTPAEAEQPTEPLQPSQVIPPIPAPVASQDRMRRRGGGAAPIFLDDTPI